MHVSTQAVLSLIVLLTQWAVLGQGSPDFNQTSRPSRAVSPSTASKLDAIIEEQNVGIVIPPPRCAVPGVAARVSQSVGIPAGIEYAPESCDVRQPLPPDAERLLLTGLTAREALNRLIGLDPRYQWIESQGVMIMRPVKALNDREHFLHRVSPTFHIDAKNYAAALKAVQGGLLGSSDDFNADPFGERTPQGSTPISVHLDTATSAYEALNAIVRTHGSLRWRVTYCAEQARHEYATLWMDTYDQSGLGTHAAVLKDENGKSYDACRSAR